MLKRVVVAFFAMAFAVSLGGSLLSGHPPVGAMATSLAAGTVFAGLGALVGTFFRKLF